MSTEVLVLGFDCVPSFSSGEVVSKRARVQSRSSEREPKGNLDGFLARLHAFPQNEGLAARQNDQGWRESSCPEVVAGEVDNFKFGGDWASDLLILGLRALATAQRVGSGSVIVQARRGR
jgi:hypothetical protein